MHEIPKGPREPGEPAEPTEPVEPGALGEHAGHALRERDALRLRVRALEEQLGSQSATEPQAPSPAGHAQELLHLLARDASASAPASLPASHRFHALPLLDPGSRLSCLQEFLPLLQVRSLGPPATVVSFGTQLQLTLEWATQSARVTSLRVLEVSPPQAKLALRPLVTHCERALNVSYLLLGCYEYSRLHAARSDLWQEIARASRRWLVQQRSESCLRVSSLPVPAAAAATAPSLAVFVHYRIDFESVPLPQSLLSVELFNGPSTVPHANHVCNALIQEYGLRHGLQEFLRAVLS